MSTRVTPSILRRSGEFSNPDKKPDTPPKPTLTPKVFQLPKASKQSL